MQTLTIKGVKHKFAKIKKAVISAFLFIQVILC